jgi:hypothetical protein
MRSLKNGFRALVRRRSYTFEQLWPKVQDVLVNNILVLASDFTTNDLWLYARTKGWIHETRTGRLIVHVP